MKILISPSKTLSFDSEVNCEFKSESRLINETKVLHKILLDYTSEDLKNLMSVSDKIADLNYNRFKNWEDPNTSENSRQAVYAFKGDVYSGLDANTIDEDKFDYLQNSLRILSGLYGILKPFDKIKAYRLEMGTKISINGSKNLYDFWKENVTKSLVNEVNENDIIVNLASNEYFSVIDKTLISNTIITPQFKDFKNGKLKIISFYAKKARGLMTRFLIDNDLKKLSDIESFNSSGYMFSQNETTNPLEPVFVR